MKTFGNLLSVLFGVALLAAIGAAIYESIHVIVDQFYKLDPQVAATAVIFSAVMLGSALLIAGSNRWAKRQDSEQQRRAEKTALYERFAIVWGDVLRMGLDDDHTDFSDRTRELRALNTTMFLRGNVSVLKSYSRLWKTAQETDYAGVELPSQTINVLREMRKDLGLTLKGIEGEDVMGLLLGPPEERHERSTKGRRVDNKITVSA